MPFVVTFVAERLHKIHVSRTSGCLQVPAVACGHGVVVMASAFESFTGGSV